MKPADEHFFAGFSPLARGMIVTAAFAVVVSFVRSAASILAPILLALFIAVIATPALRWMRRNGMPKYLAVAVILLVLLDAGSLIALMTTGALEGLQESLPRYQERLILLSRELGGWLETIGIEKSREAVRDLLNPAATSRLVYTALTNVSGTVATGLLVLLTVAFMLLEVPTLRAKLRAAIQLKKTSDDRLQQIITAINRYMLIKCLTSLGTGFCIWLWLRFLGIEYAVVLALAAVLFNFLPLVGNVLMTAPAVLMALVQADIWTAVMVTLGYVVINIIIGNVLEPRIMGRGLGISALAILVALLFWGWVLGPIGLFLSVPLTMATMAALDANPQTRPFAIMLSSETAPRKISYANQDDQEMAAAGQTDRQELDR